MPFSSCCLAVVSIMGVVLLRARLGLSSTKRALVGGPAYAESAFPAAVASRETQHRFVYQIGHASDLPGRHSDYLGR
jgi:hypothetical protein